METLVAIGICVAAAIVMLGPIIKHVIKVESYDDSQWYTDNPESEIDTSEIESLPEDESVPTDKN